MSANAVVRARIDERVKAEAAEVLAEMGLTLSDAFRLLLRRVARDKALPFEPFHPMDDFQPGPITIAAMMEDLSGQPSFDSVDALFAHLNADN